MSLLFDTPGLAVSSVPVAAFATSSKKRKIATDSSNSNPEEINLDKLMKSMRKLDQSSRGGPVTPVEKVQPKGKGKGKAKVDGVEVEGREKKKQKQETDGLGAQNRGPIRPVPVPASKVVRNDKLPHPAGDHQLKTDTPKKKHKSKGAPSQDSPSALSAEKLAASPSVSVKKPQLYTAPTQNEEAATIETPPQTAMQTQLRAKLAGGRFRMLNETLYTSTGEEARATMKDEGAFNDYHAGFRAQSSHWPVQPLSLIQTQLLSRPAGSFVADFGCGDAALARALVPAGLAAVSFDLVSKDGWVVEAECSSVPLPGGKDGGQIVDVVVCCLSLMGTDWIAIVLEARRVLKNGGELKIAEVSSRFTSIDKFIALVTSVGFTLTSKDTTNTHFVMFGFEKSGAGGSEFGQRRAELMKKADGLLKPCVYKKRG